MEEEHVGTDKEFVYVDAHILCTPTLADLDGNGVPELVVSVTYFFDREYYDHPDHRHELGEDVDMAKYIANGVVVFSLETFEVLYSTLFDIIYF